MREAWTAEETVDAERAARLVAGQFPQLRDATVEQLETGWDNTVHLVDRQWVFRFPRRAAAVSGVRREVAVLPRLAGRLPLPIPVPVFVGQPAEDYPWPFYGARLLAGTELAEAGLADRAAAASGLGAFLRALHATHPPEDLPYDPMGRGATAERAERSRDWLARLVHRGIWARQWA